MLRRGVSGRAACTRNIQNHIPGAALGVYILSPRRSPVASLTTITACVCVACVMYVCGCVRVCVRVLVCVHHTATATTATRTIIETTPPHRPSPHTVRHLAVRPVTFTDRLDATSPSSAVAAAVASHSLDDDTCRA